MRREVQLVIAVCVAALVPSARAMAQGGSPCTNGNKIALVNAQQILASIPAYAQAESLLAKETEGYRAQLTKEKSSLDSAGAVYTDKLPLYNAAQKTAEMKKLNDRNDALQKHVADLDSKMSQRTNDLMGPIQARVQAVLDGLLAAYNCSIFFDVSSGVGIASADKSLNITDRVIEMLKDPNAKPAATTPGKPPAGGIKPPGGGGGGDETLSLTPATR